jgi:hypothetical protein
MRALVCARFRMIFRKTGLRLSETIMCKNVQQQSGRWAGQDAQMTERMDAIRNIKTMAGSPGADHVLRSASRHLAMVFMF